MIIDSLKFCLNQAREHPDIVQRLETTVRRKAELEALSQLRKQRLLDALNLYKLYADADSVEAWIDEKVGQICFRVYFLQLSLPTL